MGTFNAGAIKADLTLGRTSWTRDLRKTQKEIQDLERKSIDIMLDLDTDNAQVGLNNMELFLDDYDGKTYSANADLITRDANEALSLLEGRLEALSSRTYYIRADSDFDNAYVGLDNLESAMDVLENDPIQITADVNQAKALNKMTYLAKRIRQIDAMSIDIDTDIDDLGSSIAQLETLYGVAKQVDGTTVNIDVDYDEDAMDGLVGAGGGGGGGGSLGLLKLALYALLILSPVLSVAISSSLAAVVGFAGALVAAAGPALVLGGGIALLVKRFKEAKKEGEALSAPMQLLQDALDGLADATDKFVDAIEAKGFEVMAAGVDLLAQVLPSLSPLFNETADAILRVIGGIGEFVNSPEFQEMLDFFMTTGVFALESFMHILGNLTLFFGRLFDAFSPFIVEMLTGLEDLTAGWADWATGLEDNEAFQEFIDNALEYGPRVLDMLGLMIQAFMQIGRALEPFAGPMLDALTWFFDAIANAPVEVLTAVIAGLAGLWLGMNVIVPLIGGLVTGLELLAAAFALITGPGLLIAAAIGLIAYAIYDLWQNNEAFREAVIATWEKIQETLGPILEEIASFFQENWGAIKEWTTETWETVRAIIENVLLTVMDVVKVGLEIVGFLWRNFGDDIMTRIKVVASFIGNTFSNIFQVIHGLTEIFRGIITGDWGRIKDGIMMVIGGFINQARNVWNTLLAILKAPFIAARDFIKTNLGNIVGFVTGMPSRIKGAAKGMFSGITDAFRSAINGLIRMWNGLEFHLNVPDKIPGLPNSFDFGTPNIPLLAQGGYVSEPTLAWVGEGDENEIVAPESKMNAMADRAASRNTDPEEMARALARVLEPWIRAMNPITAEDLERLIEAASVNLNFGDGSVNAQSLAKAVSYELRVLGYGGKASA